MKNNIKSLLSFLLVAIISAAVAIGAFVLMQPPKPKTLGEKIDESLQDAATGLSKGMRDAADSLDQRSPLEKAADGVKDAVNPQ